MKLGFKHSEGHAKLSTPGQGMVPAISDLSLSQHLSLKLSGLMSYENFEITVREITPQL